MAGPQEIECKFDVDPGDVEALTAHLTAAFGPAEQAQPMTSVYFDTARHALWTKGLTLRVRSVGGRHLQTVKRGAAASGGLFRRDEWEQEIGGRAPDLAAAAKTPLAAVLHKRHRRLAPVFETVVERIIWRAAHEGAVVEVALDRGSVRTARAAEPICEVEFELKAGPPEALFAVLRRVGAQAWLQPGVQAKSERGFGLLAGKGKTAVKAEPVVLSPDMTTGTAAQVILRGCLRQFRRNQPLLAGRAPEPLHQARVGLRRLRSAIALFEPALRDAAYDDIAARLRVVSRELGAARDLDVYLARSAAPQAGWPDGEPGAGAVLAAVRVRREAAYDSLLASLAEPAFRRLMLDLFLWIEAGAWLTGPDPACRAARERPVAGFAAELLAARRRTIRTRGRGLKRLSPAARHRLRIAAKKLRYATDFMASLARRSGEKARHAAFVEVLEALQADLGDLNDIAMGHSLAAGLAATPDGAGRPAAPVSRVAGDASGAEEARVAGLLRSAAAGRRKVLGAKRFWSRW